MHIRARILGVAASVCLLGLAIPAQAAPSTKATLAGSVPAWATSANFKGAAAATDSIGFRVYLGWQNPSQVAAIATAVSDPKSASYKQFLTPQQFRQQFSPSQAQVGAVQSWLKGQGFSVNYTPQNNHYVSAEGTVAQASAAFGTTFGMYAYDGLTLRSPSSAASVPSNLANIVSGVIGLDDSAQLVVNNQVNDPAAPPPAAFVSAQPCQSYWGQSDTTSLTVPITNPPGYTLPLPLAPCGYLPNQIRGAYGLTDSSLNGAGQTVAIIDAYASPTIQTDLNQWSAARGMDSTNITQIVAPGTYNHPEKGKKQSPQGWYGEETLDVEAVHGMAPAAHIVYVGAPNNFQDLDAALNTVVDRHLASIVTNSYGFTTEALPAGYIKPYEDTILQGVAEGIGIYFSSGDNSDESLVMGYATTDWPASSPFVTAVGGTSVGIDASNNRAVETGWGSYTASLNADGTWGAASWVYGSGGGVSRLFAEPSYQSGATGATASGLAGVFAAQGRTGRAVPDIAAIADPNTGYLIGETQTFPDGSQKYAEYRIGGTSLASPIMAGIMALADQASGSPHGFTNPLFYANPGAFYDVTHVNGAVVRANYNNSIDNSAGTSYRLRTFDQGLSLVSTPGYDDVTGLGTPGPSFIASLS
ncbi:MAG TPA: S53 family peptidase [Candidatus Acidoferrum sp.]|nr:S53 family peptidase [Candidatus Acidoferrum sp.]